MPRLVEILIGSEATTVRPDLGNYVIEVVRQGPQGPAGASGSASTTFGFVQEVPASVWTITHNLGYNPGGISVLDVDNTPVGGLYVEYLTTGVSLRLSFEVPLAGSAILS